MIKNRFPAIIAVLVIFSNFTAPASAVSTSVTIKSIPKSIEAGSVVTISGLTTGTLRGKSVRVEIRTSSTWKKLKVAKSKSNGAWSITYKAPKSLKKVSFRAISGTKKTDIKTAKITASTAITLAGPGKRILGLDLSRWQDIGKDFNFNQMAEAGVEFAFVKSSDGDAAEDALAKPIALKYSAGLRDAGIIVGYYHRARLPKTTKSSAIRNSAIAQATLAATRLTQLGGYTKRTLPYVLDIEGVDNSISDSLVTLWTLTWLETMEAATNRKPILYSYRSFISARFLTDRVTSEKLKGHRLWLAQPGNPADSKVRVGQQVSGSGCFKSAWSDANCVYDWSFWQYTNSGDRESFGIPWSPRSGSCPKDAKLCYPGKNFGRNHLDLNVFNGTAAQLKAIAAGK